MKKLTQKEITTILLFAIFQILLGIVLISSEEHEYEHTLWQLVFDTTLICGIMTFIPNRIFNIAHAVWFILVYSTAIIDIYCIDITGTGLSYKTIKLILHTNTDEIADFFHSFSITNIFNSNLFTILALLLLHGLCLKYTQRIYTSLLSTKIRFKPIKYILSITILILLSYASYISIPIKLRYFTLLSQDNISDIESHIFRRNDEGAYNLLYRLILSYRIHNIIIEESQKVKDLSEETFVEECTFRSPSIVLIIGESANKHHSQLYGYHLPTTPNQMKRKDDGELFVFSNVITPWNITSNVFNNVFSLYHYGSDKSWNEYPLFPLLFRQAGYHVTFLSNQYVKRRLSGNFNQAGGFFLEDDEWAETLFDIRNRRKNTYDGDFIKQDSIIPNQTNNLIIYHLHGQHFSYNKRYPKEWDIFKSKDYSSRELKPEHKKIVAHYDNATLYNDYVLEQILRKYEGKETIVIYMPDHGEECYDDLPIHGRIHAKPTWQQVHQEFEIPFWIWCSESYKEAHPDIVELTRNATGRPFMTDNLPHLLMFLAGIECPLYKEEFNLISPNFNYKRKRMIEGIVDYDALKITGI